MNFASTLRLILLAMIWGSSFLFQRVAVPELGPNWVAAGRLLLGALVLVIVSELPPVFRPSIMT